ncbi:PREDICTED: uncharacterized protein LOC105972182 [Erythranthe guttata]|uniref:uncharacterized protein LOC105972182 n=1 Tax=Erythranthe guttata TaxID=4155 RepID=UPI00064D8699|nr:PREDICTED: uncharacterized protein LOC105972182 [Erythranthe guttata]|eukprot:XP_012852574.1 PREDICTED: uncharacterized protein LOC105972182 [Erythranthe guttata]
MSNLQESGYEYWYRSNEADDTLTDLMFAAPISLKLLQLFSHVILMDCTYKTNRWKALINHRRVGLVLLPGVVNTSSISARLRGRVSTYQDQGDFTFLLPQLISCAFRRCRIIDELCRLSVSLKPAPPLVRISVSDTGIGSTLEEFQQLKYQNNPILDGKWGKSYLITFNSCHLLVHHVQQELFPSLINSRLLTEGTSDKEIHHMKYDLKEVVSSKRLMTLPSATKNGAKFSGTEVSLSICEEVGGLVTMMSVFIRKMLLLKAPKIAVELSVETGGVTSQSENIVLRNECSTIPMHLANIDYLKLGLEDYVSKHGNGLVETCHSCFSTGYVLIIIFSFLLIIESICLRIGQLMKIFRYYLEMGSRQNLKFGTGVACSRANGQSGRQVMEVVIIISEIPTSDLSSCFRNYGTRTEVLYFRDFSPCSMSQASLDALISIEWKKFGLVLKSVGEQDGVTLLEWENLPPRSHIDIVLHRYHKQYPSNLLDRSLTRKAVKLALAGLKKSNAGVFLTERAVKICSYAPDLAKTISALITSSHDSNFQTECFSLLGLQSQENKNNLLEDCIKDKIISVVAKNDRISWGNREAPVLFEDNTHHESYLLDEEYEQGEETFSHLDL